MDLRGTDKGDDLSGNNLANDMRGNSGNDTMRGLSGRDNLHGNAGADHLLGGAGGDGLTGGSAKDTLHGGSGADTFVFDSDGASVNTIDDFAIGEDVVFAGVARATGFTTGHNSVYKRHPTAQTYIKTITLNIGDKIVLDREVGEHFLRRQPTLAQVDAYLHDNILG